jgi:type IV secretory pathway VirB4 component
MGYDIPPPLKHKEKIMFELNWEQLAYASVASLIILFFMRFGWDYRLLIAISSPFIALACFFMFFDGRDKLMSFINHQRKKRAEVDSKTLKEIVDIKHVEGDIVEKSKSKIAILEVTPINYMIKNDDEKESIRLGFQKFLNSLDFPVQIHISSVPICLSEHFKKTSEKVIDKLKDLFNTYCKFVKKSIKDNNVKNRKFHLIIKEKNSLEIQCKVCTEKLKDLGLRVRRLNEKELLAFLNFSKGENKKAKDNSEIKDVTHFLLAPESVDFYPDYFKVEKTFCKVLSVVGYPNSVEVGFLDKIIGSGDDYDISIHIEPFLIEDTLVDLNKELQKQQSDLYSDSKKGIINPSLEIKFKSTRQVLEDLQKGKQKLFNVSLYIMCKGSSKEEIELLAKKVKADLDGLMIESKIPFFKMTKAYESVIPLASDALKIKRNIHTEGLAAFFPFSSPFLDIDNSGVLLGLNKNKIPYIKDIFKLSNANGVVLATSGSGKSYFTKLFLSRQYMNGADILVIDPQGEYSAIAKQYGGQVINISKNSDTIINPLDLMGNNYLDKRLSLMDLFYLMFGNDLGEIQKSILDKAVDETYARFNINRDSYENKKLFPRMQDLYQVVSNYEKKSVNAEKTTYRALLNRLGMYTDRGVFGFLNKDTKIDFKSNFVVFNIGNMPKQVKPIVMYLVLDYVFLKMKENLKRKILVIDEAWSLLQTAEESSYIFEIVKTCRKFNLGLLMITQDVADLVGSKAGHAVLANTSYTFLLRQKPAVMQGVIKTFNLSSMEKDFLVTCTKGNGILILENEHEEIEVIASEEEHKLITTNPDEIIKKEYKEETKKEDKPEIINLDIEKNVHKKEGLSVFEQNFLSNRGYELASFVDLDKVKQEEFYVKPKHPESLVHTFLVARIKEELEKKTKNLVQSYTKNADIVFENSKGEEIALEIETGEGYKFHKKRTDEKMNELKKKYENKIYLVLTAREKRYTYQSYKIPMLVRRDIKEFINAQFNKHKQK